MSASERAGTIGTCEMLGRAALSALEDDAPWSAWADWYREQGHDPAVVWEVRANLRLLWKVPAAKANFGTFARFGEAVRELARPVVAALSTAAELIDPKNRVR